MGATTYQIRVRDKGQLTLPPGIREVLGVSPGDELEFEVTEAGVVEVHGLRKIRSDQAWFWTPQWQAGEREADEDIAAGRTTSYADGDAFLADLGDTD